MISWQFKTLNSSTLTIGAKAFSLERKLSALLLYLALEGPTPRSKLAGLLWPEASEKTARNNLSQSLHRLRQMTAEELIEGGDVLRLSDRLTVDATKLRSAALAGNAAEVARFEDDLLGHYDYDDLPDFAEWLWAEREALRALKQEALRALILVLEAQGRFAEALKYAERLVELDPVSEASQRLVMQLNYLLGDRAAALRAFERCKNLLKQELDVEPLPETLELARKIERGAIRTPPKRVRREIPVEVLRPPVLVGRAAEWALMEAAWEAGQTILISGEPGIGKTRLAFEFAASKGNYLALEARPGDVAVPFATHARVMRRILADFPELTLEPWIRLELSRVLPELAGPGAEPPPLQGDADRLRFFEASSVLLLQVGRQVTSFIVDDAHFTDPASSEVASYMFSKFYPFGGSGGAPRIFNTFRRGELSPTAANVAAELSAAGIALLVELDPLECAAVGALVAGLNLPGATGLAQPLSRYTGGNPLYILETIRHLIETDRLGGNFPERLPPSGKIRRIIRRRLERLSPTALRVAQAAAILQSDFSPDLIGELLRTRPLELMSAWEELERAHILQGNRFTHDLVYEAICTDITPSVAALLHRRAAEVLSGGYANPARLARHWLAAGNEGQALPLLREAAEAARTDYRLADAAGFYEQIAGILKNQGRRDELAEVLAVKTQLSAQPN